MKKRMTAMCAAVLMAGAMAVPAMAETVGGRDVGEVTMITKGTNEAYTASKAGSKLIFGVKGVYKGEEKPSELSTFGLVAMGVPEGDNLTFKLDAAKAANNGKAEGPQAPITVFASTADGAEIVGYIQGKTMWGDVDADGKVALSDIIKMLQEQASRTKSFTQWENQLATVTRATEATEATMQLKDIIKMYQRQASRNPDEFKLVEWE